MTPAPGSKPNRLYTDKVTLLGTIEQLRQYIGHLRQRCAILEIRLQNKTEDLQWLQQDSNLLIALAAANKEIERQRASIHRVTNANVAYLGIERKLATATEEYLQAQIISAAILAATRKEAQQLRDYTGRQNDEIARLRAELAAARQAAAPEPEPVAAGAD